MKIKTAAGIVLFIILLFLFVQVIGLEGKQSLGWSSKYINTYTVLGGAALILITVSILMQYGASRLSDNPLIQIVAIGNFGQERDFGIFSGDNKQLSNGLIVFLIFFLFVGGSAAIGLIQWQPIPAPITLQPGESFSSSTHAETLSVLGISKYEEGWFISAQPSVIEDTLYNFMIPLIVIGLVFLVLAPAGLKLNETSFLIVSVLVICFTSGLLWDWKSSIIPTFAGAHSDVYTTQPSFYAAAGYSVMASFINVHIGFPISIPAHFANNWFVTVGTLITLAVGSLYVKSQLLIWGFKKWKGDAQ